MGQKVFSILVRGTIIINPDGSNKWEDDPDGKHYYVKQKMPVPEMANLLKTG